MKKSLYRTYFLNKESVDTWAFNETEARILAQAKQIEEGKPYDVSFVERIR